MFALNGIQPQVAQNVPFSPLPSLLNHVRTSVYSVLNHSPQDVKSSPARDTKATSTEPISQEKITDKVLSTLSELSLDKLIVSEIDLVELTLRRKTQPSVGTHWRQTYKSSDSFWENRYGFREQDLVEPRLQLGRLLSNRAQYVPQWLPQCIIQTRGFKSPRATKGSLGMGKKKHEQDENFSALKKLRESVMNRISGKTSKQNNQFKTILKEYQDSPEMQEKVKIAFAEGYYANQKPEKTSYLPRLLMLLVPFATMSYLYLRAKINKGAGSTESLKINPFRQEQYEFTENIKMTFDDVKGVDEAKQELKDVVEFLRAPEKFEALGAKLPKGVLLVGPPGLGKTLLARAVAGEAGVPFLHTCGSDFDEIFVGSGARRVRQLFETAKLKAPCVVFIDEIDTVGGKRTSSPNHPYANHTINQLLSEMDGFKQNEGVIVLGATNMKANLDKALLRPGRFDVMVQLFPPDLKARKDILGLYLNKIKIADDIDIDQLARGTTGCTGADLEAIVNQAALKAAIDSAAFVSMEHLEYARDKILMGPAKKTKIPDEETNLMTAYHEAGHTLVAFYTKDATPLHKVTILPRGMSLGHTAYIPKKETYNQSKSELLAMMDVAMGGRVAEELIYGADKVTTGARSDFFNATGIATAMVKEFGMSEKVGVRMVDSREMGYQEISVSPATSDLIDCEIKRLLQESYDRAKHILKVHSAELKALAQALMKYETLDASEIKSVVEGRKITDKQRL